MKWYKTLSINQRINLKGCSPLITGATFEQLGVLFSFNERIEIIHNKLIMEGFHV